MSDAVVHKFASLAHRKIKSLGVGSKKSPGLLGSLRHDLRAQATPNADAAKSVFIACEETGMQWVPLDGQHPAHAQISDPAYWVSRYRQILADHGISLEDDVRADAVLVEQQHAHFSPEVFRNGQLFGEVDEALARRLATDGLAFQLEEYGPWVLVAYYHPDEYTPHFGSFIIPLVDEAIKPPGRPKKGQSKSDRKAVRRWRLSAKSLFNPRGCSILQTRFAEFLRGRGYDVVRGIPGSRTGFMLMQLLMKFLHSPIPDVPAFVLPPEVTETASIVLDPQEQRRRVVEAAASWRRQIVEEVIPPLQAKALERDAEFHRCRGYQKTAWEKEEELKRYQVDMEILVREFSQVHPKLRELTRELAAVRAVPCLGDVAALLLGRGHLTSTEKAVTTFQLPDGMSLEIDPVTETYRRRLWRPSHYSTMDSVIGSGVVKMIQDITGWELTHSLAWIEVQWGPRVMASCLRQATLPEMDSVTPAGLEAPVMLEPMVWVPDLMTPAKASWPPVRQVLVEGYRFRPEFIDELAQAGKLGANRFGDLLVTSPGSSVSQIYPLVEGAILGDGIIPALEPFTLGSGSGVLAVVGRPLDALALWECIPEEFRSNVTVAVVTKDGEPGVWTQLRKQCPEAVMFNGLAGADKADNRANQQISFPSPTAIFPHPAKTWIGAWNRQYEDEAGAAVFRTIQERLASQLQEVLPPGMGGPV